MKDLENLVFNMENYFIQHYLIRNEPLSVKKQFMSLYRNDIIDQFNLQNGDFTKYYAQARQRNVSEHSENPDICPGYWR